MLYRQKGAYRRQLQRVVKIQITLPFIAVLKRKEERDGRVTNPVEQRIRWRADIVRPEVGGCPKNLIYRAYIRL